MSKSHSHFSSFVWFVVKSIRLSSHVIFFSIIDEGGYVYILKNGEIYDVRGLCRYAIALRNSQSNGQKT